MPQLVRLVCTTVFCTWLGRALLASAAVAIVSFPATAGLAVGTWTVVPSRNPSGGGQNVLNAVAAVSASDAWAVGQGQFLSLTEHWNGTAWSIVPSPNLPTMTTLKGVAAIASNDVWAVGDNGGQGITMHWNGSGWGTVPNPATGYTYINAISATSSNDVWAVGSSGNSYRSLVLHWNGTNWSQMPAPSPDSTQNLLFGVKVLATNNVWAVGQAGISTFILHWNGLKWSRVNSPNLAAPGGYTEINTLRSVAGAGANDLWAVGDTGASTFALHWNGSSWSVVQTPNGPSPWNMLTGVATVNSTDVWSVGFSYSEIDTCGEGCYQDIPGTLIEHWDGTSWTVVSAPATGVSSLAGLAVSGASMAWAVGNASGQTLVEQSFAP